MAKKIAGVSKSQRAKSQRVLKARTDSPFATRSKAYKNKRSAYKKFL